MLKRILRSTIIRKIMPITTAEQLETLQDQVRTAVLTSSSKALKLLTEALPEGRAKHNQTLLLVGRSNDILDHEIGNTLSSELLAILNNELRKDILVFTDYLTLADFGPKPNVRPELKPGHLLYKVPPVMELRQAYHCIIRIAHELNHVLDGIEMDESVGLGQVSVSEVMEIEVIDPRAGSNPAFNIVLLSDGEQFVDEYSATEWVFNVRPLREGSHSLVLKISVLLTIDGKERTKNIVYQREISVRAEAAAAEVGFVRPLAIAEPEMAEMSTPRQPRVPSTSPPAPAAAPGSINEEPGSSPSPPPPPIMSPSPRRRSKRMGYLSAATAVLLLFVAVLAIFPFGDSPSEDPGEIREPAPVPVPSVSPKNDKLQDTLSSRPLPRPDSL